jgi:phthalate 4,5-dioxygenase oxygenase subunit
MLSKSDSDLITRVGPGTPLGTLMREYWVPVLLASELPAPDSDPLRVRLLGEDLIAFRDSNGRIGLLGNHCPHRGASLFFGRNEEAGLRCVYHGWKFDVDGTCVDMPNEPAESNFKDKIQHTAYPALERNGMIWGYMGQRRPAPALPELEWNMLPQTHSYVSKRVADSNWLQALEGAIDTSHSNFLHASLKSPGEGGVSMFGAVTPSAGVGVRLAAGDSRPHFETLAVEAGVLIASRRQAPDAAYWRVNNFVMPFYTQFPSRGPGAPSNGHAWVPIDDERTLVFHYNYHPTRPLTVAELDFYQHGRNGIEAFHPRLDGYLPATSQAYGAWRPIVRKANDYLLDHDFQRTQAFCGIRAGWAQDSAVQEGMGAIQDRTQEHLGASDVGIIGTRRYILEAIRAYQERGVAAPGALNPAAFGLRPCSFLLANDAAEDIWALATDLVKVRPGHELSMV